MSSLKRNLFRPFTIAGCTRLSPSQAAWIRSAYRRPPHPLLAISALLLSIFTLF
jgi:hypothetical protein